MNLIKTFEMLSAMADVRRYSMVRLTCPENVLEHTAFVALLALIISLEVSEDGNKFGEKIRIGDVVTRALVHDIEEVVTGDIPRPTKYHSPESRAMFKTIEDDGMNKLMTNLEISERTFRIISRKRARAKREREGFIVDLADTLAVVYKSWDEVLLRNNMSMKKVALSTLPDLARLKKHLEREGNHDGAFETVEAKNFFVKIINDAAALAEAASGERQAGYTLHVTGEKS